jgi:PncC family amidohydrolase
MFSYLLGYNKTSITASDVSVSVAESVTAGAVCNALCSEPGASSYFKGGVVAYSIASKKDILGIDTDFAEKQNFANPFTTEEMARAIVKKFNSRYGLSTTGYSLPYSRAETKDLSALNIETPYAYICLYDALTNRSITIRKEFAYDPNGSRIQQRAAMQAKVALEAAKMYQDAVINNSPIKEKKCVEV